ncbi:uncharacterized protein LOC110263048 [Arachis ipaensis]|uniref:uncharacterized protein LOC110263048 n=1 Tax=Arachis ipaensis TaxID=130454 RepID=UPI000A2B8BCC|nr:uncharacterized protein LOC110263048 [Arachis ipaensis]XP_025650984.1 uncharacterized protein LOC112747232 [Arachis hypogaea]
MLHNLVHTHEEEKGKIWSPPLEILSGVDIVFEFGVKSGVKKQSRLHGFMAGGAVESIWSDRFPSGALADRVAQNPNDIQLLKDVRKEVVSQYIQILATRLLCVGRTTELLGAEEKVEKDKIEKLEKSVAEREGVVIDLTKK